MNICMVNSNKRCGFDDKENKFSTNVRVTCLPSDLNFDMGSGISGGRKIVKVKRSSVEQHMGVLNTNVSSDLVTGPGNES